MRRTRRAQKIIALIQGDPGGICPELLCKILSEVGIRDTANLVVIGASMILAQAQVDIPVRHAPLNAEITFEHGEILHLDLLVGGIGDVPAAKVSAAGGQSSIDGIVFMPINKEPMHLGGNAFSVELGFARDFFDLKTPDR